MADKTKILYIMPCLYDGGMEKIITDWIGELDMDRYQVSILAKKTDSKIYADKLLAMGCKLYNKDIRNRNIFKKKKYLMRVLREGQYDVVHLNTNFSADYIDLKYAKRAGITKRVCHGHLVNPNHSAFNKIMHKLCKGKMRRYATTYSGCSIPAAEELVGKKGIKSDKFIPCGNGIDCDRYRFNENARRDIRAKLGIADECILIGHSGRFEEEKNHTFIIDIWEKLQQKKYNAKLLLLGDGSLKKTIEDKTKSLGISDSVIFTGTVENVEDYLSAMDIFVFPSIIEGFGLSLLEAGCSGLACLASNHLVKDVFVLPEIEAMPLEAGGVKWAEKLMDMAKVTRDNRKQVADKLREKGLDISDKSVEILYQ